MTLEYDGSNRITKLTGPMDQTVAYTYTGAGDLATVTDPLGGVTTYTYDSWHNLLTVTDPRGITYLTNQYDATTKRLTRQTLADGGVWQFAYTPSTTTTGTVTQTVVTDPRGNQTTYGFNGNGYTTSVTDAQGQTTTITREAASNIVTQVVDPLGRTTAFGYDANKNLTSLTRYLDPPANTQPVTRTFTYEATYNQVTSATDPLGHITTFGRDAKANLTSITDTLNHTTTITRNASGQPTAITDALSNQTTFGYNSLGLLGTITDPLGNVATRTYDLLGRVVAQPDPRGNTSQLTYDLLNRVTAAADPLGRAVRFEFDGNTNLTKVTDPRNNSINYTPDTMDRISARTDQLGQQEISTYDLAGNLASFRDRKNQTTTFTYDALNRRTVTTYADASTVTATYDAGGLLTSLADSANGTISWTYDALDRVTSETTPQGTVSYAYDNAGRRTTMTVAGQAPVTYSWDNADRLLSIAKDTLIASYSYDNANRRTSLTLPNGVTTQYTYDAASRLSGLTYTGPGGTLGNLSYAYDPAGNRTAVGGSWARTLLPAAVTTASYDAANRQLTLGGKTMTFDANGNLSTMTEGGQTTTYTWDARDQLGALSGPGLTAAFAYDPTGRRSTKTLGAATTTFQYDDWDIVREVVGGTAANYLRGLAVDEPLARLDSSGNVHYVADALGSLLALADGTGSVATSYTYGPFGQTSATGAASANLFQYTGRENDGTGLVYYRARYYHAGLARFVSEDPLGLAAGDPNFYAYVGNSPASFSDPLGLLFWGRVNAGEEYGDRALDEWASWTLDPNWYWRVPGYTFGFFAALWGRKTSDDTLFALATNGGAGVALKAGRGLVGFGSRIAPYAEPAKDVTRGANGWLQAHHLIEARHLRRWGYTAQQIREAPAQVLTWWQHQRITRALENALPNGARYSSEQVWKAYQEVYRKYPQILDAIRGFFP